MLTVNIMVGFETVRERLPDAGDTESHAAAV